MVFLKLLTRPESSSSSSPVDRSQPLYWESLRPSGDAWIMPPPDVALFVTTRYINGVSRCVVFPGSEDPCCSCSFSTCGGTSAALSPPTLVDSGTGVDDSVSLTQIGQNSDTSDWVVCQCVYESAEGFVLSYVNQTLDLFCTGQRNQTICGFRRNADVGVAALSCYAALRQHGMSQSNTTG